MGAGGFVVRGGYGSGGIALAFSPDGQTLATNVNMSNVMIRPGGGGVAQPAGSSTIHMWDVATAKEIRKITLPANRNVNNLAFSPDGRVLATENTDQTLSLWEIASGRERGLLGTSAGGGQPGMPAGVIGGGGFGGMGRATVGIATTTLAFSPDGSLLATRNADQTVRVWQVAQTKEIGTFKGHEGAVQAIAFAPDGKSLASASADTTLLVWDVANLKREPKTPPVDLSAKDVETLWSELNSDDAGKAWHAIQALAAAPKSAPPLFSEKLKPATPPDLKKIEKWLADLDSTNFPKRTTASAELEKLGELAIPALKRILDTKPTPEVRRRIEPILEKLTTGVLSAEQVRVVRAVEAIENLGTTEARRVLETLAKGAPARTANQARPDGPRPPESPLVHSPWGVSSVLAATHHALAKAWSVAATTLDTPYVLRLSSTSRILLARATGVKGFCRKAVSASSTPWRTTASSV